MYFHFQASDKELIWVIRISIFLVGALSTVMALTIKSIYGLWALCSDLVYVVLFPQLICAIYVPFVNTGGSLAAFVVGIILRLGGGEALIGLSPFIKYPLYDYKLGKQLFPFRTLAMVVSLITLIVVSYVCRRLFPNCGMFKKVSDTTLLAMERPLKSHAIPDYSSRSVQTFIDPEKEDTL